MNSWRLSITFAIALAIAAITSVFVYRAIRSAGMMASVSEDTVVVAAKPLQVGARLSETDLKLASWKGGTLPEGAFRNLDGVTGRAVLYPIFPDEPVLKDKLAGEGAGAGLSAVIPEGMRAVSIRVDEVVAVAGFVGPGARVDVLLTGVPGEGNTESITETILENVQVLAAGQKIQPDAEGRPERVNVVTLLCTPENATKVVMSASAGRIQLVLRNPLDQEPADQLASAKRSSLFSSPPPRPRTPPAPRRAPEPVKVEPPPPPTTSQIQLIRGAQFSSVEVSRAQ